MLRALRSFRRRTAGFTLTEMMVAVSIFVVGGAVALPFLSGDLSLYARNFSINKSDNSLRYSLQMLKRDINMSIEPPLLMSYALSGGLGSFTPLASTATSAQAIVTWVNLGPAYQMLPAGGASSGPINPSAGITLNRHIGVAGTEELTAPLPQVGDRILFMNPAPYSTGMAETVTMNGVSVVKPGRRIIAVTNSGGTALNPSDTATAQFVIKIDVSHNNALPVVGNGNNNCVIQGNNSVYIFRETAYVAYTVKDAAGNPVERQMLYYPSINPLLNPGDYTSTAGLTSPQIITHDLDPTPQEIDPNTGAIVQPFNYYGTGRGNLTPLSVNLPIRAVDYAHAIADRNLGGATTDTSSTEFNVFLRSNPTMGIKVRLDDTSLNQITLN